MRPLLLAFAAALIGTPAAADQPAFSSGYVFNEQGGAAIYNRVCASCHQPDAKGAVGAAAFPALAGDGRLASLDYVESVLLEGRANMPALGRMMSDAQTADVINYLRTHFGNAYDDSITAETISHARAAR